MISASARKQRLQTTLFTKCLLLPAINLRKLQYYVTNVAASSAGIGSVCDYFQDSYPHYDGTVTPKKHHLRIARHLLANFRHQFGCSRFARFDGSSFVVMLRMMNRGVVPLVPLVHTSS